MAIDQNLVTAVENIANEAAPLVVSIIPGGAAAAPFVSAGLPILEKAINAALFNTSAGGVNWEAGLSELLSHLIPGQPNSAKLT